MGATTRSGLLTQPLRERFGIPLRLMFYEVEDLRRIIKRGADLLGFELSDDGATEIAHRSRGTPRIAGRLLRRIRDFAAVAGQTTVTAEVANLALNRLEVDRLGLEAQDQRYLKLMIDFYNGGPVGVETLAAALAEQTETLEEVIEPYLIQQGLIQRTSRGRVLTEIAYKHLGLEKLEVV